MSLAALLNRPCQIISRTPGEERNAYNEPIDAETIVTTVCELQQRQRDEDDDRGEISSTEWLLILPAGTHLGQGDTVLVEGAAYEVHGEPWQARNPRTRVEHHIEATLKRTTAPGDVTEGAS